MSSLPIATYAVDQNFYVEALGGPAAMRVLLQSFPEEFYSHAVDSHLYSLLYALVGPAGAGLLRRQYLDARLQIEEANISGSDLDSLYSSPFLFARLAAETYDVDALSSLLPLDDRQRILSYDASFRNRARLWMASIQAGNTPLGIQLAASSGLGQAVDVVENYKYIYDQRSDIQLGLKQYGKTDSTSEIVLIPRNDISRSIQQSITLTGSPDSGFFTIGVPIGLPYALAQVTVNADQSISVVDPSQITPGCLITFVGSDWVGTAAGVNSWGVGGTWGQLGDWGLRLYTTYAQVGNQLGPNTFAIQEPSNWPGPGAWTPPVPAVYDAYIGQGVTTPLAYNATAQQVTVALESLLAVGRGNVIVTGGPLPTNPVNIVFTNALSNIDVGLITINIDVKDQASGIGYVFPFIANAGNTAVGANVDYNIVDGAFDNALQQFAPGDVKTMLDAVSVLQPQTVFVTTAGGQSLTQRQETQATYAHTNTVEVLRYVTGDVNVPWPATDGQTNWIVSGKEVESPVADTSANNYTNLHDVFTTIAYTEAALSDPYYQNRYNSPYKPWYLQYWNTHVGPFNQFQQQLYPFLSQYSNSATYQFVPQFAIAPQTERSLITGVIGDPIGIINNRYPAQYPGLPGVQQQNLSYGTFYASAERISGTDYLEIDLGSVQAVNYLYFEATNKPYLISVEYDVMDQAPSRMFSAASVVSNSNAQSVTSLSYTASNTNPWTSVTMHVGNKLGGIIYTRFLRIGFTRNASSPPFTTGNIPQRSLPYSVEVRNLRIGRNVAGSGVSPATLNQGPLQPFILTPGLVLISE